jgi:hypothetical protein
MHGGSVAFDSHRERVIVSTNRLATIVRLILRDQEPDALSIVGASSTQPCTQRCMSQGTVCQSPTRRCSHFRE